MNPKTLESFAIRAALGNNGGTWAEHYTEDQKEHWRQFVRDLEASMLKDMCDNGWTIIGPQTAELRFNADTGTWEQTIVGMAS